jgi:hypothetical protein
MSVLLDRIVQRRRASASSRLGPPSPNGVSDTSFDPVSNATSDPDAAAEQRANGGPEAPPEAPANGLRERARMRRRTRYLLKLRELQLRDIGGFVLELHRFGRERPDLLAAKLAGAAQTDRELRVLEHALDERRSLGEVREPGIGGACAACGTVHGSDDRYCAWCGRPL